MNEDTTLGRGGTGRAGGLCSVCPLTGGVIRTTRGANSPHNETRCSDARRAGDCACRVLLKKRTVCFISQVTFQFINDKVKVKSESEVMLHFNTTFVSDVAHVIWLEMFGAAHC